MIDRRAERLLRASALPSALAVGLLLPGCGDTPSTGRAVIRVNQVGYGSLSRKRAVLMSERPTRDVRFSVVDPAGRTVLEGRSVRRCAPWGASWRGCQMLDLSGVRRPGSYTVRVGGAASPPFRISSQQRMYSPLVTAAAQFFQSQRDGSRVVPSALHRAPAHISDASATVYEHPRYRNGRVARLTNSSGHPVDVAGGWFDAGDYLKFSGTASFSDLLMLFALREYGHVLPGRDVLANEARFGIDWLLKTWDQKRRVLYEQVGLGDGNGDSLIGDHDLWRLPQQDDRFRGRALRLIAHRPVFAANRPGQPVSPNLAGREAAAFALCAQVFRVSAPSYAHRCLLAGQTLFAAASPRWRGPLAGSVPASYYAEPEWRDDMELAATELYLATLRIRTRDLPHREPYDYLEPAATYANAYMTARGAGLDTLNLYDVGALAHYDLYRVMVATGNTTNLETNASDVLKDLRDQLQLALKLGRGGPLGLVDPAGTADTVPHALGYAIESRLYDAIASRPSFETLASEQLDWVLGVNPWGSSFVVGAGSLFPRCLAHQVANLSGSHDGRTPLLAGAVVDGPTGATAVGSLGAPSGYRRCPLGGNPYAQFDGRGYRYLDDIRSSSTSEPADDFTALSLVAFAQEAARAPRATPLSIPK